MQRRELQTNPGSISSVISVESQHQYVLRSQSSWGRPNPHSSGLETFKKPCSRGDASLLFQCKSALTAVDSQPVLQCSVQTGRGGTSTANECNAMCHFSNLKLQQKQLQPNLRFIPRGFCQQFDNLKGDLFFECHVKQGALCELVWHL